MEPTQLTLLEQLSDGGSSTWRQADSIYRPMITNWLDRCGLQPTDRDDLTQDVMLTMVREISTFEHNGRLGAFRAWLRKTTMNRAREFYRRKKIQPLAQGGTLFQTMLEDLADDSTEISQQFDQAHDAHIIQQLLHDVSGEFTKETIDAFRSHVVEGQCAKVVAASSGVSRWAVYQAKSRVLRRLRERIGPWAEDMGLG